MGSIPTFGNNVNIVYQYDIGDRLTRITNNTSSGSIDIEYSDYDKVGNRRNMLVNGNEDQYTYDKLYRLKFVDYYSGGDANYFYDALGNRDYVENGATTIDYSLNGYGLNQYGQVDTNSYSYDAKGNLTNDGEFKYYYDCENRLIDVNDQSDNPVASYEYDYLGHRIQKTVYGSPDVVTKYCYDGGHIIGEYDGSDTLLRKYVYGPGIDEPICMIDVAGGNALYYYHFDGLGSVVALSNNSGNVVEKYSYDVFGTVTIRDAYNSVVSVSSVANRFMFTGREYDSETGNYYYRARYYNPEIGRFLQTDPVGYRVGLNLYSYVDNNPLNLIDPSGLFKWGQFFTGVSQSAGGIAVIIISSGIVLGTGGLGAGIGVMGIGAGSLATASGVVNIIGAFLVDYPTIPSTILGHIDMGLGGTGKVGDLTYDIVTGDGTNTSLDILDIGIDKGLNSLERYSEREIWPTRSPARPRPLLQPYPWPPMQPLAEPPEASSDEPYELPDTNYKK